MTFVASMRLGEPASIAPVRAWLDLYPALRFKLDPTSSWGDELVAELAASGAVDSVDLKGSTRAPRSTSMPTPRSMPVSPKDFPTPGSRIRS